MNDLIQTSLFNDYYSYALATLETMSATELDQLVLDIESRISTLKARFDL